MMASHRPKSGGPVLIAQLDIPQRMDTGDFHYRTQGPGRAMAEQEGVHVVSLSSASRFRELVVRHADILILHNICDPDMLPLIKDRRRAAKPTIYELADDLAAVPPWNPVHPFYRNPDNQLLFKRLARSCDAMQFSSLELERKYGELAEASAVFENQIFSIPPQARRGSASGWVVGWGGSYGHLEDMRDVSGPLSRWLAGRGDIKLHLMSAEPIWRLFASLPETSKRRFPPGSLGEYHAFLNGLDIGIAPLLDTPFNRSRSDVKFLEYAARGVVPVMQRIEPYARSVRHGVTGYLFDTPGDLVGILDVITRGASVMERVSKAARSYVLRERLQRDHVAERLSFYMARLDALHRGCLGRESDTERIFDWLASQREAESAGRYLALKPGAFETLLCRGLLLCQEDGGSVEAHRCFLEAARLCPESHLPHLYGAFCSGDAIGSLEVAIRKNPRSIHAWMLLAEMHARAGRLAEAMICLRAAVGIFPEYEVPYLRAANLLEQAGFSEASASLSARMDRLASSAAPPWLRVERTGGNPPGEGVSPGRPK